MTIQYTPAYEDFMFLFVFCCAPLQVLVVTKGYSGGEQNGQWKEKAYSCTPVQPTWWQLHIIRTYMLHTVSVKHTQKHPHPKTAYVCTCTRTHRNTPSTDHTPDWLSQLLILTAQSGTPVTLLVQILYTHAQLYSSWPTGLHTWICAISPHPQWYSAKQFIHWTTMSIQVHTNNNKWNNNNYSTLLRVKFAQ